MKGRAELEERVPETVKIDNLTGIPCAYIVHGTRRERRSSDGAYEGGGYIMLCNHQSPGIASVMVDASGRHTTDRMKRYRQLGSVMSVIDEAHPGHVAMMLDKQ